MKPPYYAPLCSEFNSLNGHKATRTDNKTDEWTDEWNRRHSLEVEVEIDDEPGAVGDCPKYALSHSNELRIETRPVDG